MAVRIPLPFSPTRVIDGMTAVGAAKRRTTITTFTIDERNPITAFISPQEAAASTIPLDAFSSQQNLAELAVQGTAARLAPIWNSLPGVTPVHKFKDRQTAVA